MRFIALNELLQDLHLDQLHRPRRGLSMSVFPAVDWRQTTPNSAADEVNPISTAKFVDKIAEMRLFQR
jgi:hypothetical protein